MSYAHNHEVPGPGIGGNVLVVGPAKCEPRDMFLCRGLPGLGGDFATSDDRDVNMSVDLATPSGGNCRPSSGGGLSKCLTAEA